VAKLKTDGAEYAKGKQIKPRLSQYIDIRMTLSNGAGGYWNENHETSQKLKKNIF
jgi:hypothetical protein